VSERLQRQARALGEPTRHRIFEHVAGADHDVDVAELTRLVGLNHTTVREHLATLVAAGLFVERHEHRSRPGRPRLLYRVAPGAAGTWDTASPYERLGLLLLELLRTGEDPVTVGRGAAAWTAPAGADEDDALAALVGELGRSGFEPQADRTADAIHVRLGRCPFSSLAAIAPGVICALHRGIAEGMTAGSTGLQVEDLVVEDPSAGGCRLVLRRT